MTQRNLFLAIDVGNTTIECGIYRGEKLLTDWRLSSGSTHTPDERWQNLAFFSREADVDPTTIHRAAIASVAPAHTYGFTEMIKSRLGCDPLLISAATCPFIEILYDNPDQVGADRLCHAYAGFQLYGGPLIIVDFGTEITFDVIDADGAYLGGVILPGPKTTADVLHRRTAQLPMVSFKFPDSVIGKSTDHAIQAGLSWGLVDMTDGMIDRIRAELGANARVVATGGFAKPYAARSRNFSETRPDLVLEGIRRLFLRARAGA